jgi:hypothetical protein
MKGRTIALVVVCGLGGFFLAICGVCGGGIYWGYQSANKSITPEIEALFRSPDIAAWNATFDTRLTPEFQASTSRDQYQQLGEVILTHLGPLKSASLRQVNVNTTNGITFANVTYAATFEKGDGQIVATLKGDGEAWRFQAFRVESPLLTDALAKQTKAEDETADTPTAEAPVPE